MRYILSIIIALGLGFAASAGDDLRHFDAASDTVRVNELLQLAAGQSFDGPEAAVAFFGLQFLDTPYVAHTLECEGDEQLTVNLSQLDCTTFAETALALAMTQLGGYNSWRAYADNLRRIRYRGGIVDGYASRLHYISDWAVDNGRRGNLTEVTATFPRHNYILRDINYMSAHRDAYPALKDSAEFGRILDVERRYRKHRFPYIPTADLSLQDVQDALHSGDVLAMVSTRNDLDVTHLGIVIKDSVDVPHLLHASYSNGKVELTRLPLAEFIKRNKYWMGVRVFRLGSNN